MSAILDCTLELARQKVRFFPVRANSKLPAVFDFSTKATSDPEQLTEMFDGHYNYNSGIACGKIHESLYLVGFDIDNKDGRNGYETLELMAELGEEFPTTWAQKTPSGGEHRLFYSPVPIRQGTNVCGSGIDFRGDGGYLVGPGSMLNGVPYHVIRHLPIVLFPRWAIEKYEKKAALHAIAQGKGLPAENQILALKRSVEYLGNLDPVREGARNHECFKAAAKLKDFGLVREQIPDVLLEYWPCEPMLSLEEIHHTVNSAFNYAQNPAGSSAPEKLFPLVEDPIEKTPIQLLNDNHFYCASNGITRVYKETTRDGRFHLERYPVYAFHEKYLARKMQHNNKLAQVTQVWMSAEDRREYECLKFDPSNTLPTDEYNIWRGFAVKPHDMLIGLDHQAAEGLELFLEHCEKNVCRGDKELTAWLLDFMAHIFQKPEEKPEVCVVFKGRKGTGKTIVSEILNKLIGGYHSVIIADKAHAVGHFNSVMEDKLLVTLDEAFWSGDKQIEGILKHIITGSKRLITYKGAESYTAKVYDRIFVLGNEEWAVPTTADERRFAVFNIGDGRRQDRKFFGAMKEGLFKHGGDGLLMRYFLNRDLSKANINAAPQTEGLYDQKRQSLGVFQQWWFHCLQEGQVLGHGIDTWLDEISCHDFYDAFSRQCQTDGNRAYKLSRISVGMLFKSVFPSCGGSHVVTGKRKYQFAPLEAAREEWDKYMEYKTKWD